MTARPCPECKKGAKCSDHKTRAAEKQAARRARRIAEGVDRATVWGHAQKPSGTGWDAYNARRAR